MKRLSYCLIGALALCASPALQAQPNAEASKLAKEGFDAAKAKDWDKAVEAYRRAAHLDPKIGPNLSAALQQRAFAYIGQQKFPQALADCNEALKISPNDASIRERRAYVEMQLKDYDKALSDYSELIKERSDEAKFYLSRSYIYEVKGDIGRGLADCEKILQLEANNPEAMGRQMRLKTRQAQAPSPAPPPPGKKH
jgi:tetratricopeptide (TPR) repeat protein